MLDIKHNLDTLLLSGWWSEILINRNNAKCVKHKEQIAIRYCAFLGKSRKQRLHPVHARAGYWF